jgi:RecA/RadA recombinase
MMHKLLFKNQPLSPRMDAMLGGGIRCGSGGITEIAGEAGLGKTQLSLQLALRCQLPLSMGGLQAHSAYISGSYCH